MVHHAPRGPCRLRPLSSTLGVTLTHRLDFAGSYESLFYLRHLAAGSKEFCKRELLHFGAEDYIPDEWAEYQHQLHLLASRSLIGCAVNLRVLQDTLRSRLGYSESVEASSIEPAMTAGKFGAAFY